MPVIERTHRFAKFLRAAVAVKSKPVVEVNKYPFVTWFSDLPRDLKEVRSPLVTPEWPEDDLNWLVVRRVVEPERPGAPAECQPWLVGVDLNDVATRPQLQATRSTGDDAGTETPIPDPVRVQFDAYLSRHWDPWAEKARVARAVGPIYRKLFGMFQELKGKEDAYDVYAGVGLLDSRADPAQRLHRHFLAFPAELRLDEKSGTIAVGPSPDASGPRTEVEFLPTTERGRIERAAESKKTEIEALWPMIHDRARIGELLSSFANQLAANAEYVDSFAEAPLAAGRIRVCLAPAIVMRPRTARSLDELLAKIEKDTSDAVPPIEVGRLPNVWRRMLEDGPAWGGASETETQTARTKTFNGRVFFPLPSNDEQSKIIRYATGSPGVVVQGPPGTGKSHTIANLISHYLASGQRVLVTAQTAQALEVLRDKMPGELQDLCVCLLGNSRQSDKDLQRSVKGILARQQDLDQADYDSKIARLEHALNAAEAELVSMDRTLTEARARETVVLEPVPGYRGTKAVIARQVSDERAAKAWIGDVFDHTISAPTYAFGWERLADYHQSLDEPTRVALAKVLVEVPFTRDDAQCLIRNINTAKGRLKDSPPLAVAPAVPKDLGTTALVSILEWLRALERVESRLGPGDRDWFASIRRELLQADLPRWKTLAQEASEGLARLTDTVVTAAVPVEIENHSREEALRALSALSQHYAAGGRRRILFAFKPGPIKAHEWVESAVRVGGISIRTREEIDRARLACETRGHLDAAWVAWEPWAGPRRGSIRQQRAELQARGDALRDTLGVSEAARTLAPEGCRWLAEHLKQETVAARLASVVQHRLAELELASLRQRRDDLAVQLGDAIAKQDVVLALNELVEALLLEDEAKLASAFSALEGEYARRVHHRHYLDFVGALTRVAPVVARGIRDAEGTSSWRERFSDFEAAWDHRRAALWLDVVLSADNTEAVHRAAREQRQRVQDLLKDLTAAKAWKAALGRIDDRRRASLVAWAKAVAAIPATGLSVFRKRAVARQYLGSCLETIPAWVVSLGRLYETVDAQPGLFDVAIVDEASQCWLDALVLFYLAKQVIIVGDDKQISPTVVGVGDGQIAELASTYLRDLEYRGSFSIESSLFDHGQRYLSAGVPLREHFRCVPEIIRFSNDLCYADRPLIPLRSVGGDRLPPLKTTYLADGMRRGDVNEREAEAIVEAVAACHADPAYEDAEFGVICLQGDAQAAWVEQLLLDRLGPSIFEERNLRCGNPYAFQGDERDVIFLSMVAAPNADNASLTTRMFEQRFNVALSRGRDQLWLFHSIKEQELGPNCLRRRVLEFFRQPPDLTIHGVVLDIPSLQVKALRANRAVEPPPRPFDSWFEVDVALALANRGFRLSAQVAVGSRRIDLVIDGDDGSRLAVECDGDAWHGPEQHEHDLFRQRQLERVGWRFVRVRESLFHADRDRAIGEVVGAAEECGIYLPGSVPSGGPGLGEPRAPESAPSQGGPIFGLSQENAAPVGTDGQDSVRFPESGPDEAADAEAEEERTGVAASGPFTGYEVLDYPDPRSAPPANVRIAVLDIVRRDGPLPRESVYRLYREGCPRIARAGRVVRLAIDAALRQLQRSGEVEQRDEGVRRNPSEVVVKTADQQWVQQRVAGARGLEDVPLSELAVAAELLDRNWVERAPVERAELLRRVARDYGVQRVKEGTAERLKAVDRFAMAPGARGGSTASDF